MIRDQETLQLLLDCVRRFVREVPPPHIPAGASHAGEVRLFRIVEGTSQVRQRVIAGDMIKAAHA